MNIRYPIYEGVYRILTILLRMARCSLFGKFAGYADKEAAGST